MSQEKYIGMDVHQATVSVAVGESGGKLIMECILETKAATILDHPRTAWNSIGDLRGRNLRCLVTRPSKTPRQPACRLRPAQERSAEGRQPIPYLRFAGSLAVAAQDSGPGGSLLLSCKTLSFSTSCRFSPAHCNRDITSTMLNQ